MEFSPSCDILVLHVFPFGDFITRLRMAACNLLTMRKAASAKDAVEVRKRWGAERLAAAGAPEGLLRHLDVGLALKWMKLRDLAHAGSTGYIDYLTPRDFVSERPVLYGRDPCGRFYLAACFVWRNRTDVACLFQRYGDDRTFFLNCLDGISEEIFTSSLSVDRSRLAEHHANLLELVMQGQFELPSGEPVYLVV